MKFNINNKHMKAFLKSKKLNDTMHVIAMEELAELAQAISKRFRGRQKANANIIEEIADVMIALDFIMNNYKIKESEVQKVINQKLDRADKRVKHKSFT